MDQLKSAEVKKRQPRSLAKKATTAKRTSAAKSVVASARRRTTRAGKKALEHDQGEGVVFLAGDLASKKKAKTVQSDAREEIVKLPGNMSQRAIAKSVAFMAELDRRFGESVYKIAYVSAFCFMAVGATYAVLGFLPTASPMKAELMTITDSSSVGTVSSGSDTTAGDTSSSDGSVSSGDTVAPDEATVDNSTVNTVGSQVYGRSEFSFLTSIPSNITEPTPVSFSVTNAELIQPKIVTVGKTGFISLPYSRISDNKYRLIIPTDKLAPDYYELRVYVKPLDGSSSYARVSNKFFVGTEEVERWYNDQKDTDSSSTVETSGTSGTSNTTDAETISDTATVIDDSEGEADTTTTESEPLEPKTSEVILSSPNGTTLSGAGTLWVTVPPEVSFIELYARPVNGINARFIALATKRFDRWVFAFDSKNLPNGEYEFFAKTKHDGNLLTSRSVRLSVANTSVTTTTTEPAPIKPIVEDRDLVTIASEPYEPTVVLEDAVVKESTQLLMDSEGDLNELLQRYAVAIQTGDPSLIQAARDALEQKRELIAISTIQNERVRDISDNINDELTGRITQLQQRVELFEELRKERSGGATAIDTDGDGVSDTDELKLYGTDANNPDSDGDGINDGIEIMRGFDALDAKPEAVVRFESPKESLAVVRSDVLEVMEVIPVAPVEQTSDRQPVVAEIRGRGLPNSFVTLYIFSMPTVVTVRTDADGSFVYTFDKELEDGQHDVYVAVTDNAGEIVARSNPFSFVKQAEAFTPVAAAEASVVTPDSIEGSATNGYRLAIGMGILSLGLILLMLGVSLRLKRDDEVVVTETPVTPS